MIEKDAMMLKIKTADNMKMQNLEAEDGGLIDKGGEKDYNKDKR
jgi:hypothetical protein